MTARCSLTAQAAAPPDYASTRDDLRSLWLGNKNLLDRAVSGEIKRPPEQIERYRQILHAIGAAGAELVVIAANAESYEAWKNTVAHSVGADAGGREG